MKVLERKELSVVGICPHCGSKLELEKGDVWWHKDIDGGSSPCVTCAACGKGFDVEGWKILKDCIRIDSGYFPKYCEISSEQMIAWIEKQGECQVKESAISQHENKTCKENNDSLTSKDDMMIEETLYFLREYQQSNRCKDESGMQNSVTCEKWLKSLKERINGKQ